MADATFRRAAAPTGAHTPRPVHPTACRILLRSSLVSRHYRTCTTRRRRDGRNSFSRSDRGKRGHSSQARQACLDFAVR